MKLKYLIFKIVFALLVIACLAICTYVNLADRAIATGITSAAEPSPIPDTIETGVIETAVPLIAGMSSEPEPSPEPKLITSADWYGVAYEDLDERLKDLYIPSVEEVDRVTRTMGDPKTNVGEYFGYVPLQLAGVPWCICNRHDLGFGKNFTEIITPGQFHAYSPYTTVDLRLRGWAIDVITRWINERLGFEDVGRVLPQEFVYFSGNGRINTYRDACHSADANIWDWSLPSPYES